METFSCTEREQWRAWLMEHWSKCTEVWFIFPTLKSGEKCISYNDAVEEALCFGWIDGRSGRLDENHHLRRFTPRKKGSKYSQPNIERLIKMDAKGMIHPQVWKNCCAFPATYRRIRVAYLYGYIQCRCCSVH